MGRYSDLPILYDFCKILSISDLKKWNYLRPNYIKTGTIEFKSCYDILNLTVKVVADMVEPYAELSYKVNDNVINYRVDFELLPSNLGKGKVWYFLCPITKVRCKKLYLIGNYFQHRTAYGKGYYQTQTLGLKDRYLIRLYDMAEKSSKARSELSKKYFKKYYKGKPTKRYLKLLNELEAGGGISVAELMMR